MVDENIPVKRDLMIDEGRLKKSPDSNASLTAINQLTKLLKGMGVKLDEIIADDGKSLDYSKLTASQQNELYRAMRGMIDSSNDSISEIDEKIDKLDSYTEKLTSEISEIKGKSILSGGVLSDEDKKRLDEINEKLKEIKDKKSSLEIDREDIESAIETFSDVKDKGLSGNIDKVFIDKMDSFIEDRKKAEDDYKKAQEGYDRLIDAFKEYERSHKGDFDYDETVKAFEEALEKQGEEVQKTKEAAGVEEENTFTKAVSSIQATIEKFQSRLNSMIDNAANTYSDFYSAVSSALNSTEEAKNIAEDVEELGLSSVVKQTDVLKNIATLTQQGITSDLEQIALLTTIKDKTVSSFNATDSNLRRLIKLNQQRGSLTASQFGLMAALKESFNQTFKDTSFLNDMFQSLTGVFMDTMSANSQTTGNYNDSTDLYSVLETYLGAMYEAGMDSGSINSIAQGINYLGSGNISALSGNKTLQNLLLLSADRAGLDYATILQEGLSTSNAGLLLQEIIDYLAEITDTTKDNNVLQSSYANLFNLSISDLTAIQNLASSKELSSLTSNFVSYKDSIEDATAELSSVFDRTWISERYNNISDNAQYAFGSGVSSNVASYSIYKASNIASDIISSIKDITGNGSSSILNKVLDIANSVSTASYIASIIPGALNLVTQSATTLKERFSNGKGATFNEFFSNSLDAIANSSLSESSNENTENEETKNSQENFKQFKSNSFTEVTNYSNDLNDLEDEEESADKLLEYIEKTLMKSNEGNNLAFAVSLQGMSDTVLRSFASIFADEDSLADAINLEENENLKKSLISYVVSDTTTTTEESGNVEG